MLEVDIALVKPVYLVTEDPLRILAVSVVIEQRRAIEPELLHYAIMS
jgi:hypothetical protein